MSFDTIVGGAKAPPTMQKHFVIKDRLGTNPMIIYNLFISRLRSEVMNIAMTHLNPSVFQSDD